MDGWGSPQTSSTSSLGQADFSGTKAMTKIKAQSNDGTGTRHHMGPDVLFTSLLGFIFKKVLFQRRTPALRPLGIQAFSEVT